MSEPRNPLENADQKIEQFERVRDQNLENILSAADFDSEADFWDAIRGDQTLTVEIDVADLVVILSELEDAAYHPETALGHVHTLDLLIQLTENHQDALNDYIEARNEQMAADMDESEPRGFH
jgi:hypothetical protein